MKSRLSRGMEDMGPVVGTLCPGNPDSGLPSGWLLAALLPILGTGYGALLSLLPPLPSTYPPLILLALLRIA